MAVATLRAECACENTPIDGDALLLDALRRWKAVVIKYTNDPGDGDSPAWMALLRRADSIVAEIARIPASGLDGLAIKFYFSLEQECGLVSGGSFDLAWNSDRAQAIGAPALADALRLAPAVAAILEI